MKPEESSMEVFARDPEEVRERLRAEGWGDHYRIVRRAGEYTFRMKMAVSGRTAAGNVSQSLPTVVRAAVPVPTIHLPVSGEAVYRLGRRTLRADPLTAVFLAPGHEYTLQNKSGTAFALAVETGFLLSEIEARRKSSPTAWSFRSGEIPLRRAGLYDLVSLARRFFVSAAAEPETEETRRAEQQLCVWLSERLLRESSVQPLSERSMRRAVALGAWMDAHLAERITLDDMCKAVNLGKRSLQNLCISVWGMTPIERLQHLRLAATRRLLEKREPDANITRIALECGFTHLGRFSILYRQTYGEAPSATAARLRATDRRHVPPPPRIRDPIFGGSTTPADDLPR